MKIFLPLASVAAVALALSACTDDVYGGGAYWDGPVAYDGWYDGFYGPIYDGYWGSDGFFYYRHGDHDRRYFRGDRNHFARGDSAPRGNFRHFQGAIQQQPQGVRMPHFSGGAMHGGAGQGWGGLRGGGGHDHQGH